MNLKNSDAGCGQPQFIIGTIIDDNSLLRQKYRRLTTTAVNRLLFNVKNGQCFF
jgi:hypothetical protein